jgi:hypothetical protein
MDQVFMSEQALRQEISALRTKVEEMEDWTNGIQESLIQLLPHLLRGHPEVAKVQSLLHASEQRYEELLMHPDRAEDADETAGLYESRKMLYRLLGLLGVWPDVTSADAVQASLRRSHGSRSTKARHGQA